MPRIGVERGFRVRTETAITKVHYGVVVAQGRDIINAPQQNTAVFSGILRIESVLDRGIFLYPGQFGVPEVQTTRTIVYCQVSPGLQAPAAAFLIQQKAETAVVQSNIPLNPAAHRIQDPYPTAAKFNDIVPNLLFRAVGESKKPCP